MVNVPKMIVSTKQNTFATIKNYLNQNFLVCLDFSILYLKQIAFKVKVVFLVIYNFVNYIQLINRYIAGDEKY